MNDEQIIKLFFYRNGEGKLNRKWQEIINNNNTIKGYLETRYDDYFASYKETLFRIKHHIEHVPKCKICHTNYVTYVGFNNLWYNDICTSPKCRAGKISDNLFKKTGYTNVFQFPSSVKKIRNKHFSKSPEEKQAIKDKRRNTVNDRFGCDNVFQNEQVKEKIQATWQDHYGKGIINPGQAQEVKDKIWVTWIKHYGGHPFRNKEFYQNYIDKLFENFGVINMFQLPEVIDKIFCSKLKHGTIGKTISHEEQEIVDKLKPYFPDLIQQYKDKQRYPWKCDMYIPSLDLFIEYHGSHYHNYHPFDMNLEKDIEILNDLIKKQQEKQSTNYARMIEGWTIVDPLKMNTAKESHLNMIIIYRDRREYWLEYLINKVATGIVKVTDNILY